MRNIYDTPLFEILSHKERLSVIAYTSVPNCYIGNLTIENLGDLFGWINLKGSVYDLKSAHVLTELVNRAYFKNKQKAA